MAGINSHNRVFHIKHPYISVCLFLVLSTFAVYGQVLNHDFVNFDDVLYVTENRHVQEGLTFDSIKWAFTTVQVNNWHPLTWLSHMLDCQLYGMNPGRHHLTSLLFHISNAILLFVVLRKMTGALWRSGFVAALFALHPLHVESVAWVSERKDVLSTFFWVLTMWSYIWYAAHPAVKRYLLVVLFFALGLMSKPMLVTLPFVLLLLDFYPLDRLQFQRSDGCRNFRQRSTCIRLILEKIPLFVLAAMSIVVTVYAQGEAVASLEAVPLKDRAVNALVSYVKYMGKMVYPSKLSAFYPHSVMPPLWKIAGACLLLASISYAAVRVIKKRPYVAVGWLWYLGTLVPVIGLVQVGSQSMADRYTYIPLIGLFVIISWGFPEIVAQWRHRKMFLAASAAVVLTILMPLTWRQAGYWENSITLFRHALKVTSNNSVSHYNLGVALYKQGRTAEAIEQYSQALRITPRYVEAYNNMGIALDRQGRTAEAIEHYLQALRIKPDSADAHYNLAIALDGLGRAAEAVGHYLQALRIQPDSVDAYNNLGNALYRQGRTAEAIEHYKQALRIKPDSAEAHNNMGISLDGQGRAAEAVEHYKQALRINPDYVDAYYNLGISLDRQGRTKEAIEYYLKALRIKPDYEKAHNNLGIALFGTGNIEGAIEHFQKALNINPDYIHAKDNLKKALMMQQQKQ